MYSLVVPFENYLKLNGVIGSLSISIFPDILRNAIKPIFLKFGMEVHWVNSLYGIAFGGELLHRSVSN